MESKITFFCFLFLIKYGICQTLIEQLNNNAILLYELKNKKEKELIETDKDFAGYNLNNNILEVYFNSNGIINKYPKKINVDSIFVYKTSPGLVHYYPSHNNYTEEYSIGNLKLIILDGGNVITLKVNDSIVWKKYHGQSGPFMSKVGYQNPQISKDLKHILFQRNFVYFIWSSYSSVVEIDVETGSERVLCRKCQNPSYSPDSNYILYENWSSGNIYNLFYVYNKQTYQTTILDNCLKVFWLKSSNDN